MIKQSKEFNSAFLGSVNSAYQSAADGELNINDILQYWIDDIGRWQEGIKDFNPGIELRTATNLEMDELKSEGETQMADVPSQDAYDISAITHGAWAAYRLIARKSYNKGKEDAVRGLVKAGVIKEADLQKMLNTIDDNLQSKG